MQTNAIEKQLSSNDVGKTGGHQAGILIPKQEEILKFFPALDKSTKNPRAKLTFTDESGEKWSFSFIYYNNKFFGGTRNEYRLTCMTPFIKSNNLDEGDTISLHRNKDNDFSIKINRFKRNSKTISGKLILGSSWKIINI